MSSKFSIKLKQYGKKKEKREKEKSYVYIYIIFEENRKINHILITNNSINILTY